MNLLKIEKDRGFTISTKSQDENGQLSAISFSLDIDTFMSEVKEFVDLYPDNEDLDLDVIVEKSLESLNKGNNPFNVYSEVNVDNQVVFAFDVDAGLTKEGVTTLLERSVDDLCNEIRDQAISRMEFDEDSDELEFNFNANVSYLTPSLGHTYNYSYFHKDMPAQVQPGELLTVIFETEAVESELDSLLDGHPTDQFGRDILQSTSDSELSGLSAFYDDEQKEMMVSFRSDLKAGVNTHSVISSMESKVNQGLSEELSGIDRKLAKQLNNASTGYEL
ncbi:hypothetical protein [Vibrio harveyi]|uniref:hypothetical protein n=1 Tax=Vibrio harveyi TaxID=669 RepID=UPI003CF95D97